MFAVEGAEDSDPSVTSIQMEQFDDWMSAEKSENRLHCGTKAGRDSTAS